MIMSEPGIGTVEVTWVAAGTTFITFLADNANKTLTSPPRPVHTPGSDITTRNTTASGE
jgi:hypothetical protein